MLKSIPDIEFFDQKVKVIFKEAQHTRCGLFNINEVGKKMGLQNEEIETLHYHLKRNNMIEDVNGPILKLSKYGQMINKGTINQAYVPI